MKLLPAPAASGGGRLILDLGDLKPEGWVDRGDQEFAAADAIQVSESDLDWTSGHYVFSSRLPPGTTIIGSTSHDDNPESIPVGFKWIQLSNSLTQWYEGVGAFPVSTAPDSSGYYAYVPSLVPEYDPLAGSDLYITATIDPEFWGTTSNPYFTIYLGDVNGAPLPSRVQIEITVLPGEYRHPTLPLNFVVYGNEIPLIEQRLRDCYRSFSSGQQVLRATIEPRLSAWAVTSLGPPLRHQDVSLNIPFYVASDLSIVELGGTLANGWVVLGVEATVALGTNICDITGDFNFATSPDWEIDFHLTQMPGYPFENFFEEFPVKGVCASGGVNAVNVTALPVPLYDLYTYYRLSWRTRILPPVAPPLGG